jgi:hypothetical protein
MSSNHQTLKDHIRTPKNPLESGTSNKVHVPLCLIPIHWKSLEVSDCRLSSHLYRTFCFSMVLLIQSSQLNPHLLLRRGRFNGFYMSGSATLALSCVFVIDNFCLAVYTVDSHICFLLLTRSKTWMDLIHSFALLEESMPCSDKLFISCRKLFVKLIIYLIFLVRIYSNIINLQLINVKKYIILCSLRW